MKERLARLLFPGVRWNGSSYAGEHIDVEAALAHGVGGFIVFGGEVVALADWTRGVRARSRTPLLIGADLERGAGQQFLGATPLPPLAALGTLEEVATTRRAGEVTAREALAMGVNWVYAPVADVDLEPQNPIVGTRAFGTDPARVAAHVAAWIDGCHAGGALSCAKHFPGHGRTRGDSHLELPAVDADIPELEEDLAPFRAAVGARVDSLMTAHVAYPALDATRAPATLSRPIIHDLLRGELGFDGLVVTDALIMEGVLEDGAGEGEAAVRALAAGCDALLYPADLDGVLAALESALGAALPEARVDEALARLDAAARRTTNAALGSVGESVDREWALDIGVRSLVGVRGTVGPVRGAVDLVTVDDDAGGPYPPGPRDRFADALRERGLDVRDTDGAAAADDGRTLLVALYCDIRGWKGRPGVSEPGREAVRRALAQAGDDATLVLFGHPRLAAELPGARVLAAWGGEALMQEAAAAWLTSR